MSLRIGPKVDLTGVVLNLDAGSPASYNGEGSIWYDLSGRGNHFTLQGTPLPSYNIGTRPLIG
jgi:hypothetical protein